MSVSGSQAKLRLWKDRMRQFRDSELTVERFCDTLGVCAASFYYWKRKLELADVSPTRCSTDANRSKVQSFLPVVVKTNQFHRCVSIKLPGGVQVRVPCSAIEALAVVLDHAQQRVA